MPKAKEVQAPVLRAYGYNPNDPRIPEIQRGNQLFYERLAFASKRPLELGALARYEHFRNICKICWPWLEWNPWMEMEAEALCNHNWVAFPGCASSCKTTIATIYAVVWWLCDPARSTVVLTSTTGKMIRKRAWPWVQRLYSMLPGPRVGNMVDSKTTWQDKKGDDKNAIFALPVRDGSTQKAVANIAGMHNRRVLLVIDEATDTPEAVFEVIGNLIAGCVDFQVIFLGNPQTRFDPFGQICEPKDGWQSVDIETQEWEAKPKFGNPVHIIRLDAERSPNIIEGKNIYKHIPTIQSVTAARETYGENSPRYFQMYRGMWAPEGVNQTVLTESLLIARDAFGKHIWLGGTEQNIAGLDPAFGGGDRPVLQFGRKGELANGGVGLQVGERVLLKINTRDPLPVHYQIAHQVIAACKQRGVPPECFGLDSTGEGGGLADIIAREWSLNIRRVEFGGKPPENPVSNENNQPAHEVYDRMVTYLWFSIKEMVVAFQLKGLDATVAMQLTSRRWRMKGKKIEIEPKTSPKTSGSNSGDGVKGNWGFKEFFGRSPDEADALAVLVEVARRNGLTIKTQGQTAKISDGWHERALEADSVNYEPEEEQLGILAGSGYALDLD